MISGVKQDGPSLTPERRHQRDRLLRSSPALARHAGTSALMGSDRDGAALVLAHPQGLTHWNERGLRLTFY